MAPTYLPKVYGLRHSVATTSAGFIFCSDLDIVHLQAIGPDLPARFAGRPIRAEILRLSHLGDFPAPWTDSKLRLNVFTAVRCENFTASQSLLSGAKVEARPVGLSLRQTTDLPYWPVECVTGRVCPPRLI